MYIVKLLKTGYTKKFNCLEEAKAYCFEFEHLIPVLRDFY